MARLFSTDDAFRAIQGTKSLIDKLNGALFWKKAPRESVVAAKNTISSQQVLQILQGISVEELSNEQSGIKVKTLLDAGFLNYADLHKATVRDLYSIQGISVNGAQNIKFILDQFIEKASKKVKIRLSFDDKNPEATALVQAVAIYKKTRPIFDACQQLLQQTAPAGDCMRDLEPGLGTLKWIFTGREKKQKAEAAYTALQQYVAGDFPLQVEQAVAALEQAKNTSAEQAWNDFLANPIDFYNTLEELCPGATGDVDSIYGLTASLAKAIETVSTNLAGFKSTLRRYQEWGVKYILHQKKVLLGDEMGLGKTIQAIAAMVSLRNTVESVGSLESAGSLKSAGSLESAGPSRFMVVCPASVITNWCREIRFHSDFEPIKIHGPNKMADFEHWKENGGIAVTTFETTSHLPLPEDYKFDMLVVDEAQYIKNPMARRSKHVRRLCEHSDRLLFMTGTAIENHVGEMLELMRVLNPDVAIEAKMVAAMSHAPDFMGIIAPVYYRRKREDVLSELPELISSAEWCELNDDEEAAYDDAVLCKSFAAARRVSFNVGDPAKCSKLKRLLEIVEEAKAENRKVIVFSYFLDTIRKVQDALGPRAIGPINGSVSPKERQNLVDEFNGAPAGTVLVSQILAGGVGLNIQAASVVILCEPQLKPSLENQAISRAYRMGQARSVLVYRLLAQGTIDERIMAVLHHKQTIFDAFADKSIAASVTDHMDTQVPNESVIDGVEINDATFKSMIEDEIKRIKTKTEKILLTDELLESSYEKFNQMYFDGKLPQVRLVVSETIDSLGSFIPGHHTIYIAAGNWIYQNFRNTLVHEMCHLYVDITVGAAGAGAGDGHGKDWLAIAEKLNAQNPELRISMYGDERPD